MFKAIKDNKIIGICETEIKGGGNFDEMIEDTEHTIDDYEQYDGEYILKSSVPVDYKNEQIRQQRQSRFATESDPLYLDYVEAQARLEAYTGTSTKKQNALKKEVTDSRKAWLNKKDEIREQLPKIDE